MEILEVIAFVAIIYFVVSKNSWLIEDHDELDFW